MSELIQSICADLNELVSDGLVPKTTLKEFESTHMAYHVDVDSQSIKALRKANNISQAVLAKYLNLSAVSVRRWEQGATKPRGSALVLLNLIREKGLQALM